VLDLLFWGVACVGLYQIYKWYSRAYDKISRWLHERRINNYTVYGEF
jgi:hypothetical protein